MVLALLLCFFSASAALITVPSQEIGEAYADISSVTYPLKVKVNAKFQVNAEVGYMSLGFMELATEIFDLDLGVSIDKRPSTIFKEGVGFVRYPFTLSAPPRPKTWHLAVTASWASKADEKLIPGKASGVEFGIQVVEETVLPTTGFNITVSPEKRELVAGESTTFSVRVDLISGEPAPVKLNLEAHPQFPEGIQYLFRPDSGTSPFDSTLEIATSEKVAEGHYPFYVVGEGGGMGQKREAYLKLEVVVPPKPIFEVAVYCVLISFCLVAIWLVVRSKLSVGVKAAIITVLGGILVALVPTVIRIILN